MDKRLFNWAIAAGALGAVLFLLAGAGMAQGSATSKTENLTVRMQAESFKFEPDYIKAEPGTLTIDVENPGRLAHNLTVRDPQGKIIASVDIPAHQTEKVQLNLTQAGIYEFYCDHAFHSTLGMKGRIVVSS